MSAKDTVYDAFARSARSAKIIEKCRKDARELGAKMLTLKNSPPSKIEKLLAAHNERKRSPCTLWNGTKEILWDGKGRHPFDQSEAVDSYSPLSDAYENDLGA